MSKQKHIVVSEETHRQLKKMAVMNDMTMMEYVAYLIDKEKKQEG